MEKNQIENVRARLQLVKKLSELRNNFKGDHLIEFPRDGIWEHPYRHFSALRFYLLLTCFDILGSTRDYVPFSTWLESKTSSNERDIIVSSIKEQDIISKVSKIYSSYNDLYGPTQGFKRFISEVLSEESRNKLYKSVQILKIKDGQLQDTDYHPSEKQKINFLLKIRNSFTHSGLSFATSGGGLFSDPDDAIMINNQKMWSLQVFYKIEKTGYHYLYGVRKWPSVLIEIIEETIKDK